MLAHLTHNFENINIKISYQVWLGISISISAYQWLRTATAANCKQQSHQYDSRTCKALH